MMVKSELADVRICGCRNRVRASIKDRVKITIMDRVRVRSKVRIWLN